jgi:hypothetical protein
VGTALALAVYAALLAGASVLVWRRPLLAVYAFIVGLALHNAVMAGLYGLGVRGHALTVIAAWKEVLLAVALARVGLDAWRARRFPFRPGAIDALALAFAGLVLAYALIPQNALGGRADAETVLYAIRHDLTLVGAFFLGRSLALDGAEVRRLAWWVLGAAAAVAAVGIVEEYTVPIEWWRDAHVPGYFTDQLGFDYHGPARLPENFVFNTGNEQDLLRRLVSTFLSPLGTAFMLVAALCLASVLRLRPLVVELAAVCFAGLLFTHTRAGLAALAVGVVVLAVARRRLWPVPAAVAVLAAGAAFTSVFPSVAPETHWFPADLAYQRARAKQLGVPPRQAISLREPSIRSHLTSLRDGIETVTRHPQGYGLGNAGATAARRDVPLKAGESTYTELGAEIGIAGMLLFVVWNLWLLAMLVRQGRVGSRAAAGVAAALAAVLALAVQTDVLGVPWIAFCVWLLGGALLVPAPDTAPTAEARLAPWAPQSTRASTSATST